MKKSAVVGLRLSVILLIPILTFSSSAADRQPTTGTRELSVQRQLRADEDFLTAPAQEGRGLGTKGLANAAMYLEKRMKAIHLEPAFGKSYRQKFPVKTGVSLGPNNNLTGVSKDDWTPLGFSSSGPVKGEIVFVGYGIEAPPLNYRELDGVDLKGKVALMLRYEPQEKDDKSVFDGRKPSRWSAMRYKVLQARERGATAVIFTTGPLQDEEKDKVPALKNDGPESPAGIPVLQVKTSVAQKWLTPAGIDLLQFQKDVDADLKARSKATGQRVDGIVDVNATFADAENLAGFIPGHGAHANQVVVLGAHYDHLGYGGKGSMKPNITAVHPGADDNASGTVSVLQIAERLSKSLSMADDHRAVLVVLFAAEEMGLGGSSYFVAHPPPAFPMDRVVAMVNLDMVGAMKDDKLIVFGSESAPEWNEVITQATVATKLDVSAKGDGYGPSDQTAFYAVKIPVLHLFTGTHDRYHAPEDTADKLNYEGMSRVVDFGGHVVNSVALAAFTPRYARVSAAPAAEGDSRGYGAYLGTIPDYSAMESTAGGVKLSDVRPGGPADKAGIKGGDVIVEMAGTKIENLYDMTYALQDHKPGQTIDVIVIRDGKRVTLPATLGTRGGPAPEAGHAAPAKTSLEIKAGKPFETKIDNEKHLKDVRQLTFGGENAEAYFSPDGTKLIYQAHQAEGTCDQQYVLDLKSGENKLVSSGKGRTTCGYFSYPKGDRIIYASTEAGGAACPPAPDMSQGYVWAIYPTFDIYEANADGTNLRPLVVAPGYDAEATWCHQGGKIIFTSTRDGDLDLYQMDEKGGTIKRLTNTPGYDGGAFYSPDCKEIVWRADHPTGEALEQYRSLLKRDLIRPSHMELFVANADGSNTRQITSNGAANFCPYFTADGKRIIFTSNVSDKKGREFELYLVPKTGGELERVTYSPGFDGFPMFSPDGQWLVWASNRSNPNGYVTNLFIAKWVE